MVGGESEGRRHSLHGSRIWGPGHGEGIERCCGSRPGTVGEGERGGRGCGPCVRG